MALIVRSATIRTPRITNSSVIAVRGCGHKLVDPAQYVRQLGSCGPTRYDATQSESLSTSFKLFLDVSVSLFVADLCLEMPYAGVACVCV
jgi:hypothetical protein